MKAPAQNPLMNTPAMYAMTLDEGVERNAIPRQEKLKRMKMIRQELELQYD
jgi:hypothetical protein